MGTNHLNYTHTHYKHTLNKTHTKCYPHTNNITDKYHRNISINMQKILVSVSNYGRHEVKGR